MNGALIGSISPGRLVGASITVLLTTLEDAVWLAPLLTQASSLAVAMIHALTFVVSFVVLSLSVGLATLLLEASTVRTLQHQDVVLSVAGASLCWLVAVILYCRAWNKRRRRRQEILLQHQSSISFRPIEEEDILLDIERAAHRQEEYGTATDEANQKADDMLLTDNHNNSNTSVPRQQQEQAKQNLQIWLVMILTFIGAIDEVSYFPGLIAGSVFSVAELTIGTLIASLAILAIVTFFLVPFQPIMNILDRIPLYGIVAVFAILLTVEAIWQMIVG